MDFRLSSFVDVFLDIAILDKLFDFSLQLVASLGIMAVVPMKLVILVLVMSGQ